MPPLPKAVIADDEECLPWKSSGDRTTSLTSLKVPAKARREYEKGCAGYRKKKFSDAEKYLRGAIGKFENYPAAWVLLGVVLDEQEREPAARDACSRAAKADAKYLPAYLCAAEFAKRSQEWSGLFDLTNVALSLNPDGNGYIYYYRAMACLHLNNLADAEKSAQKAAEMDVNHNYVPIYFLLAQIYDSAGNRVGAAAQLLQVLKHHPTPNEKETAEQYLSILEAEQTARAAANPSGTGETSDAGAVARNSTSAVSGLTLEAEKPDDSWIPDDIDRAMPPVAAGVACSLPDLLNQAGQRIVELVQNVDRFTAKEILTHRPIDHAGHMGPAIAVQSSYLVSFSQRPSGYMHVEEFRDGLQSLDSFPAHIATIGTPSLVLIFHPRYVENFNMECEGLGDWYGQPAWQVRFEQRADRLNRTLEFSVNREEYRVNLKGRAWILADSFQIARLETDLEESIPKIRLRLFHQSLEYRPVKSLTNNRQLWLPSGAELYMDFQGHRFYRELAFTDFTIFSVGMEYQTSDPKGVPPDSPNEDESSK